MSLTNDKIRSIAGKGRTFNSPVDAAIAAMRQLPKLPVKRQHLKQLGALVRLNKLMSAADKELRDERTQAA